MLPWQTRRHVDYVTGITPLSHTDRTPITSKKEFINDAGSPLYSTDNWRVSPDVNAALWRGVIVTLTKRAVLDEAFVKEARLTMAHPVRTLIKLRHVDQQLRLVAVRRLILCSLMHCVCLSWVWLPLKSMFIKRLFTTSKFRLLIAVSAAVALNCLHRRQQTADLVRMCLQTGPSEAAAASLSLQLYRYNGSKYCL